MNGLIKFTIGLLLAGFFFVGSAQHTQLILSGTIAGILMGCGICEWIVKVLK